MKISGNIEVLLFWLTESGFILYLNNTFLEQANIYNQVISFTFIPALPNYLNFGELPDFVTEFLYINFKLNL
jgi:hypothetical protein